MDFLANFRARAGIPLGETDSTLLFATAGLAIGEFEVDDFEGNSDGSTHLGLVVGGGVEHKFTDKYFREGRIQLHADFESKVLRCDVSKVKMSAMMAMSCEAGCELPFLTDSLIGGKH